MSYTYSIKIIKSGKQVEVYKYHKSVWRDYKADRERILKRKPEQLNIFDQQKFKKKRSAFSLRRTRREIRRLVNSNTQLNKFLTLTFAENISDLKTTNYIFNKFVMRVVYQFPDFEYLAVPEFQKRGAVHYHLLCNLPVVQVSDLQEIWGQGFIKINKIDNIDNVGAYVSKYLSKETDERNFGKKKFFRSQSLKTPDEILGFKADKFEKDFLSILAPVYESVFESAWTGKVEYKSYFLQQPIPNGVLNFYLPFK